MDNSTLCESYKKSFYKELEETYLLRCRDGKSAFDYSYKLMEKLRPGLLFEPGKRPSFEIAAESGDLGLAVLWNSQVSTVRLTLDSMMNFETDSAKLEILKKAQSSNIGILAMSEDLENPVLMEVKENSFFLKGRKKYIMTGKNSDFFLITINEKGEFKPSKMVILEKNDIPKSFFKEIDKGAFKTLNQSRLEFKDFKIQEKNILSVDSKIIRKSLKIYGLMEVSLITESISGLILYLLDKTEEKKGLSYKKRKAFKELAGNLSEDIDNKIQSLKENKKIKGMTDFKGGFADAMDFINDSWVGNEGIDEIKFRLNDMNFYYRLIAGN